MVTCPWANPATPECNYIRVQNDLATNGFSEKQVQAILFKSATELPQCDLSLQNCQMHVTLPDAYLSEEYLGRIMRYLKQGLPASGIAPRYPNLKQVFITSRTYGGYANGTAHGCLSPEPYAFESGFAVQKLIVAQIKYQQQPGGDGHSGSVGPNDAPWINWGPYLWTNGDFGRADGLLWCNGQSTGLCQQANIDVRWGDKDNLTNFWGDHTHPSRWGAEKVALKLVDFIQSSPFVTPWILPSQ
jgi:hypothetical protein